MTPPIHIQISPHDDAPIYRQVVRQVIEGVATGSLEAGEQLPSLRSLAQRLAIAPLTVKKAYDVLESDGVIETRRGQGTFISTDAVRSTQQAVERVRPLARRLVSEASVAAMNSEALAALIKEETEKLNQERSKKEKTQ